MWCPHSPGQESVPRTEGCRGGFCPTLRFACATVGEADVFETSGRLIAIAEWPRAIDLYSGFPVINGTAATAVATDTDGVERIVRLRFR